MILEIIFALFLGILFGTITGLIPGIHINLVGVLILGLSTFLLKITSPTILIIFISSMSITHTFIDFIPSIFLGAPDEGTVLSILPGHELLKKGQGFKAITLSSQGSYAAIISIILLTPLLIFILPKIEFLISKLIPFLLITSTIFLISQEKYKISSVIVFLLSGFLGIGVLNSSVNQPFLPMLSGLFGASSLIISIKNKVIIPKQKVKFKRIKIKKIFNPVLASSLTSPLCCFLPGLGSGQAAILGTSLIKRTKQNFLILLGATNTIVLGLSFVVFYILGKSRTGMAATISQLTITTSKEIFIILITISITGILSYHLTLFLGKQISKNIHKINYSKISSIILLILSILVLTFSGIFGFFIFIISTSVGIFGILSNVKRTNLMGCLILPVILIYI
jgi:putative membrane protein